MKAIALNCPNCGAAMRAEPTAATATCDYCHTTAHVQKRTGMFTREQLPANLPRQMPVARQKASPWRGLIVIGALAGIGIGVGFAIKGSAGKPAAIKKLETPQWSGIQAGALIDINGDGTDDIIGRARVIQPELQMYLIALDGATGERIWLSENLGEEHNAHQAPLAVTGDAVLLADGGAGLSAFAVRDGSTRWTIRLNEKIEALCAGDGGPVVRTADDKGHPLTVADGAISAAAPMKRNDCRKLPGDASFDGYGAGVVPLSRRDNEVVRGRIDGMYASEGLHHLPTDRRIAIGYKKPGSRVGMLASYSWPDKPEGTYQELWQQSTVEPDPEKKEALRAQARLVSNWDSQRPPTVLWKTQVPGIDPMKAKKSEPDHNQIALTATHLVVAYETETNPDTRLTAFDPADGRRLWDVELTGDRPMGGVFASSTHAYVSRWTTLEAFDINTGERAFLID